MKSSPQNFFRDHTGKVIEDISGYVQSWQSHHPEGEIYIGSDSKVRGARVKYSTVICLWNVGNGVSELYKNEVETAPRDAYTRLWSEVTRAIEVADILKDISHITVHVDINSNPKYRSHQLYDASIGLIKSMGFKGAGKPFSWAASCGAHRHCQ